MCAGNKDLDGKDATKAELSVDAKRARKADRNLKKRWYVIQGYSGHEKRIKMQIEERIKLDGLEHLFGIILIPSEKVI